MKATEKDIVIGATLFYVYCVKAQRKENAKLSCKVTVTSNVKSDEVTGVKCFECTDDYRPYCFDWLRVGSRHYLDDCGVNDRRYNLHRLFTTEESALAYVEECKTGVFTDPLDQAVYNKDVEYGDHYFGY